MNTIENQRVLDVLNNLEVIEENGGEEAYILVANNEENRKRLNAVGVSNEIIDNYGDKETFCILALACSEGYADWTKNGRLIKFDQEVEIDIGQNNTIHLVKYDGDFFVAFTKDGGEVLSKKLSPIELNALKKTIA